MVTRLEPSTPGYADVQGKFGDDLSGYDLIQKLETACPEHDLDHRIIITFAHNAIYNELFSIKCLKVSRLGADLALGGIGPVPVVGFQVVSLKHRGLGRIHWEVSDDEDGTLEILCRRLELALLG